LTAGLQPSTFKGKIEFRNVCFSYPTRPDRWVLRNFSMTIMPGQSCALVGESGCGKSSVILLILRFYEPQSGEILLDDVPVSQLNVRWLRENCALVQQEPALFADSIQCVLEALLLFSR
jgi:ATP-binding cassette subfamily B (MDR/TAP) protein 1